MHDEDPPCNDCEFKPPEIHPENIFAMEAWGNLHALSRPIGMAGALPITTDSMINLLRFLGKGEDDLIKLIAIEKIVYEKIQANQKEKQFKKK